MLCPQKQIPTEFKETDAEYQKRWGFIDNDDKAQHAFTPTVGVLWVEEQVVAKESIQDIQLPILMIEAEGDEVVRNDHIVEYFHLAGKGVDAVRQQKSRIPNKFLSIKDCDHSTICYDKDAVTTLIRETVLFFNKLIGEKQKKRAKKMF